jgi:hypothetical protein
MDAGIPTDYDGTEYPDAESSAGLAGIPDGFRWPGDPRKHHRLIVTPLHRHGEGRQRAVGHIVAPAFDHAQRAVLDTDRIAFAGVGKELLFVGGGYCKHETVDIGHGCLQGSAMAHRNGRLHDIRRAGKGQIDNAPTSARPA